MSEPTRGMPADPLTLAEAVASGAITQSVAESALRAARGADTRAATAGIAEMNDLLTAIRGVRRHAAAFQGELVPPAADAARPLTSSRVARGEVRLRPASSGRPAWAMPGLLAAAAVIVIAVIVGSQLTTAQIAATPSPSAPVAIVSSTPSPSPSDTATPSSSSPSPSFESTPTPAPSPTPAATIVDGLPSLSSQRLAGAPGVVYWTLTAADRIAISTWEPDGSVGPTSFSASTWKDPTVGGVPVIREVIASPDGRRVAFSETYPVTSPPSKDRLRVFDTHGRVLWTDPAATDQPDIAWSADGQELVVGSIPATWKIVTFHGTDAPSVVTRTFEGQAYRIVGFSRSGSILYGWDTNGEAEFWQTPFRVRIDGGTPTSIDTFSGQADPIGASNGTTPATTVDPVRYASWASSPIDPVTGRVVDLGGLSGQTLSWELRDSVSAQGTPLGLASFPSLPYLSWTTDGSLVIADMADDQYRDETGGPPPPRIATIRIVRPEALDTPLAPVFSLPAGTYDRWFYGTRQSTTLIGLGAHLGLDPGFDELVAIDLATAGAAVFGPADTGLTGLHVAGWITAP